MVQAFSDVLAQVLAFLPLLLRFLVVLLVGFVIARVLTSVLSKLLKRVGFNRLVERGGLRIDAATVTGRVVFATLMLFVLSAAFGVFGAGNPVSRFLAVIISYLPLVLVAILIVVIASAVAAAAKGLIQNSLGGLSYARVLANLASGLILGFGVIAALNQLGIAENVVNAVMYAVLAALVGIAVVAVGGGGITPMRRRWEQALARYDQEKPKVAEQVANAPSVAEQARQAREDGRADDTTHEMAATSALDTDGTNGAPVAGDPRRGGSHRP